MYVLQEHPEPVEIRHDQRTRNEFYKLDLLLYRIGLKLEIDPNKKYWL